MLGATMKKNSHDDLPPDRSFLLTEQRNPRTMNLHRLSTAACVELITEEDKAVYTAITEARPALTAFIEAVEPRFCRGGRLIYIGAGTSGRLGVLDASECPPTFQVSPNRVVGIIAGGDSALRRSSESKEDDPDGAREELERLKLTSDDSLLGIASGGTTPYVLGAMTVGKELQLDILTGLLVCTSIHDPRDVDHLILIRTGAEALTGSTRMKAGTATKMALNTISTTLMVRSGRVYENLMVDLRATNDKLHDRAARIIATLSGLSRKESLTLLDTAGNDVKTAILMHRKGVSKNIAEKILLSKNCRLDHALED